MKNIPKILLLALLAFLASEVLMIFQNRAVNPTEVASRLQSNFTLIDQNLKDQISIFAKNDSLMAVGYFSDSSHVAYLQSLFDSYGLAFFIYYQDSLVFWSNNNVPFDKNETFGAEKGVLILQNGWYFFRTYQHNELKIIGLAKVYSLFKYQNRFLVNDFHPRLAGNRGLFFVSDKGDQVGFRVLDSDGEFAFSLVSRRERALLQSRPIVHLLALLFAIYSLISFVVFAFKSALQTVKTGLLTKGLMFFVMSVASLRLFIFVTGIPSAVTHTKLFHPEFYASSRILPSLGDLLLNVLLFGLIGFLFYSAKQYSKRVSKKRLLNFFVAIGALSAIIIICWQAIVVMEGLVLNSQLSLGVGFVFDFNLLNFIGFFIIAVLFFSVYFFSQFLLHFVWLVFDSRKIFWLTVVLFFGILLGLSFLHSQPNYLVWLFLASMILVFYLGKKSFFSKASFGIVFLAFFIFSVISTIALLQFNNQKSQLQRKSLALSLSSDQDHLAEFLFLELEDALLNDHQLKNLVINNPLDEAAVYRYLKHHYFFGFWEKFELQVTVCKPGETRIFMPYNYEIVIVEYFESLINEFGRPTLSENFIFLDNNYSPGRKSYISRIPVDIMTPGVEGVTYYVYLEFNTKFGVRETGLPELLVDDKADVYRGFEEVSYAKYLDGRLVHKMGNFVYSFDLSVYGNFSDQFTFFHLDGYEHLVYKKSPEFHLLVSSSKNSFIENIAPFSYLFLLMFVISLFLSREGLTERLQITFKRRVQIYMVTLVAFSVVSIGVVSLVFLLQIYEQKNLDTLNEKSQSVLFEMQTIFGNQEPLSERHDYFVYEELLRLHRVFFTDINIFSPGGVLVASSRPRVFAGGLVGTAMNPVAFSHLQSQQKGQFVHNEKIGNLQFVSSYLPLHNNFGELIGYINLPYFARQSQLRNEISLFVLAFVNIITILLMIALIVALIASNYVTAPLQLIKDSISRIQLGRTNQKLQWKRRDEIGQLVMEYNRMIDEIEKSAGLLAKSERESAWREMAKQVAHEIKNPLTPMRLSIQHLEKAYHDNMPDWDKRLERFSRTMIEQIDNLSIIASEFSDFAKMPTGKKTPIDLENFVTEVIELFNYSDKVSINLDFTQSKQPLIVMADKNQITRVFNNLVNNAIQAYSKDAKALVVVNVEKENDFVRCSITDYGIGIPDELKNNIFRPYFTTKTGGMGLGLSMVKSIVENHGGDVFFDSKLGEHTTFSFTLPVL